MSKVGQGSARGSPRSTWSVPRPAPPLREDGARGRAKSAAGSRGGGQLRTQLIPVAEVFAANQVNATIFRQSALISWAGRQHAAYYDPTGEVVVASRDRDGAQWSFHPLGYRGAMRDGHNSICIGVSPDGLLHLSYDHHGAPLRYRRGLAPGEPRFGPQVPMTGLREERVTYPQFVGSPDGRFYFLYRDGRSGNGDLCVNAYEGGQWQPLCHPLVSGEGRANPYWWRPGVGADGSLHLAWCWRRTGDGSTNRDVSYAVSRDGGRTWRRTDGSAYTLPITADQAEVADPVPEGQNLINSCCGCVDAGGRPHLVHYRNDARGIPQVFHVRHDGARWRAAAVTQRTAPFTLAGGGTLRPPLSRPDVVVAGSGRALVVYRDDTAGGRVRLSWADGPEYRDWTHRDLTDFPVGAWEPSYDPAAWRQHGRLELWVHRCEQGDHEVTTDLGPQPAYVLCVEP